MPDCKSVDTPMDKSLQLSLDQCLKTQEEKKKMKKIPYTNAVGSLMYTMMCIRPDICYAVGKVSRYQSNLRTVHWGGVKRIPRYLKGTQNMALFYQSMSLRLVGYSDADGSADID